MKTVFKVAYSHRIFLAMSLEDAARTLGVSPSASKEEIDRAYKKKVMENHPDRGGDPEAMVEVNVAKDILDGKARATPEPGGAGGYSSPSTSYKPPEKRVTRVSFHDAWQEANIPTNVQWVFKTNTGHGSRMGDSQFSGTVLYGKTDSYHFFVSTLNSIVLNAFTGEDTDVWEVHVERVPVSMDLTKVAPKVIREMFDKYLASTSGYNAKVMLLDEGFDPKKKNPTYIMGGRYISFKDAMEQLGLVGEDSSWKNRKLSVVLEVGTDESRKESKWDAQAYTFIINGKVFPLSSATNEYLQEKTRVISEIFGSYVYSGSKKDVTRSKNGKKILGLLSQKLVHESQELRDLLARAAQ